MRRNLFIGLIVLTAMTMAAPAMATNGTNLIGVGSISRSMGGVGVAAPQDAISAVFANPAAMCMGPYCPGSQADFDATFFKPTVKATITTPGGTINVESQMEPFIIPAVGISTPISDKLRFGFGAYGVSGMGVDYRDIIDLDPGTPGPQGEIFTMYQVMRFAPNLAWLVSPNFSLGANLQIVYASLDLGGGTSHNYATGVQLGGMYRIGETHIGLSYTTEESIDHDRVMDTDMSGLGDATLALSSPQSVVAGVSFEQIKNLLVEFNVKWYNWADADGYKDFDWEDQTVYAIGGQYKLPSGWAFRAGYNFAKSPVKEHNGWTAFSAPGPPPVLTPEFGQEYLRVIGLPAVVESHVTLGLGYEFSERFQATFGYMHAFSNDITETSVDGVILKSELEEDSFDFGLKWTF